jgi:RNA polymerase sigma-70 factor (ECF subfamily)
VPASIATTEPIYYALTADREAARGAQGRARTRTMRDYPGADDAELMAWTAAGDRLAFDALAARHLERAHRTALRMLGDPSEAEDVTQDAMLRIWQNASSWDPRRSRFTTWLYRIVVNAAIDARRRPRALRLDAAGDPPDPSPPPSARLEQDELAREVASALAAMPDRQRAALALTYYEGLSGQDAASVLSVSVRGLEGLLRRGRRFLRERLDRSPSGGERA